MAEDFRFEDNTEDDSGLKILEICMRDIRKRLSINSRLARATTAPVPCVCGVWRES